MNLFHEFSALNVMPNRVVALLVAVRGRKYSAPQPHHCNGNRYSEKLLILFAQSYLGIKSLHQSEPTRILGIDMLHVVCLVEMMTNNVDSLANPDFHDLSS